MYWDNLQHPKFEASIKVLIYDKDGKLFFAKDIEAKWDLPGGRLDEGESIEQCLKREILEELGVEIKTIGKPHCIELIDYDDHQKRLFIAFKVELENFNFKPSDENVENRFVSKDEFEELLQAYKGLRAIKDKLFN